MVYNLGVCFGIGMQKNECGLILFLFVWRLRISC